MWCSGNAQREDTFASEDAKTPIGVNKRYKGRETRLRLHLKFEFL